MKITEYTDAALARSAAAIAAEQGRRAGGASTTETAPAPVTYTAEQFDRLLAARDAASAAAAPAVPASRPVPAPHPASSRLHAVEASDRRNVEGQIWDSWAVGTGVDRTSPFWSRR